MLRSLTAGLFLICGILFLFSCNKTPQIEKLPSDAVVLAFGDSITFGTGAAPTESYPSVLAGLIGRNVVNAGVPGETTGIAKQRLAATLDENRPALMLLCLGGNDFLQRQDEAQAKANLGEMIAVARNRGVAVVLIGVPKLEFGLKLPTFYQEIARENDIPLESEALKRILSKSSLKSDAIHPNAAGYRLLAESVAKLLRNSGAL
ncbi:arylesterase [Geobacter sp. OR-1]|uniref:arylesterase n=1 Tax=Geobacter sp. OR-1 TaxID=1266765 RepID=UPI000543E60D|nr:arylesterase [Geobacter sp. OR-1]GAM10397.1 arylesterase [Geobacter sp. OR-1]